mgnify:CR=1 FL=1
MAQKKQIMNAWKIDFPNITVGIIVMIDKIHKISVNTIRTLCVFMLTLSFAVIIKNTNVITDKIVIAEFRLS